ncbi:hypothetical protein WNY37_16540 [Henriciella sp. AS95]|uniref:hypothetical protein n=1 Tax=Henriciella sp. AS95 TaxID=3135782 RepID=UPI00316E0C9A
MAEGKDLWIPARAKAPDDALIETIKTHAEELGYEAGPLMFVGEVRRPPSLTPSP